MAAPCSKCNNMLTASGNGHVPCVEAILRQDPTSVADGGKKANDFPIHKAATNGFVSVLEVMEREGGSHFDVNLQNKEGNAALHRAAMMGKDDVVKWLLLHGADQNVKNRRGKTAAEIVQDPSDKSSKHLKPETRQKVLRLLTRSGDNCRSRSRSPR